ncbi:J domain-containing protein [Massilia pseudoviolaceinigra]|uniref:J domain-containing protein n=1 Tax=Massilia pseudoviolaceinigra TaxID=3057165 RepID=UPI0027963E24|nr:J domain-containing protein [Massilia sp. CCM 9206]MDQ1919790.1 J domain-containing protein [Massilia sp. CCM 9206]
MNVWSVLGMKASRDERAIKRAYAAKLKVTRPEDDPVAFQLLNDAYQAALQLARQAHDMDWPDEEAAPREQERRQEPEQEQPVYMAAYEFDPEPARTQTQEEAPIYTAFYEFDPSLPQPEPKQYRLPPALPVPIPGTGPESPVMEARRIWAAFLTRAHQNTRERLEQLFAGEELLNIEVRDCFEECAVQYCAGEGCEDDFREAMAGHFGWADDASFMGRQMPDETGMMLARLRAQRSYAHFCQLALEDEVVRALLDGDPRGVIGRYPDAAFTQRMRELLEHVHCYHGEMLDLRLDADIVERWEAVVHGRGWSR